MVEWARANLGLEIDQGLLTGISYGDARDLLWNAFDQRYRPEMRMMERRG